MSSKFHGSSTENRDQGPAARARRRHPAELLLVTFNPNRGGYSVRWLAPHGHKISTSKD